MRPRKKALCTQSIIPRAPFSILKLEWLFQVQMCNLLKITQWSLWYEAKTEMFNMAYSDVRVLASSDSLVSRTAGSHVSSGLQPTRSPFNACSVEAPYVTHALSSLNLRSPFFCACCHLLAQTSLAMEDLLNLNTWVGHRDHTSFNWHESGEQTLIRVFKSFPDWYFPVSL